MSFNQISVLPVELGGLPNLNYIEADANPLTSPPLDVVNRGSRAILDYLQAQFG